MQRFHFQWNYLLLCLFITFTCGCGRIEPEINTSYPYDTTDTVGPYQVNSLVIGEPGLKVYLVYSTDRWKDAKNLRIVEMKKADLGMEDVFVGKIAGQPSNTTVHYYILVQEADNKVKTDPEKMAENPSKLLPQNPENTYQFRILE